MSKVISFARENLGHAASIAESEVTIEQLRASLTPPSSQQNRRTTDPTSATALVRRAAGSASALVANTTMKNLVGWYGSHEPLWWLSFGEPDEDKPWWKFWRRAKEGEFLGVVIVQAPDIHEAVQVAWRKKINPGGEVCGVPILNADLDDLDRLIPYEEAEEIAERTKVLETP